MPLTNGGLNVHLSHYRIPKRIHDARLPGTQADWRTTINTTDFNE